MRFTIDEAARATGGSFSIDPVNDQAEITSLTWDSRNVEPGALYVALPGERVDKGKLCRAQLLGGKAPLRGHRLGGRRTVLGVAQNGEAAIGAVDPQLVRPAGYRLQL